MLVNCLSVFDHFVSLALKGLRTVSANSWLKNNTSDSVYEIMQTT